MEIDLKQFRCHTDSSFCFPEKGLVLVNGNSGKGKCLGKGTKILLFNGEITQVENVIPGDVLIGDDSKQRKVLATNSGNSTLYCVWKDLGYYIVNKDHILTLCKLPIISKCENNWKIEDKSFNTFRDAEFYRERLVSFGLIEKLDISLREYLLLSEKEKQTLFGYRNAIIYPYKETKEEAFVVGKRCGMTNSQIPVEYILNDRKTREQVIQGMISSNSDTLSIRKDFCRICWSLGLNPQREYSEILDDISLGVSCCLYRIRVDKKEKGDWFGFELDGNGRFLLEDFSVTHNSSILNGLLYALYGEVKKPYTFGSTGPCSVSVSLGMFGISIRRQSRPSRFVVIDHENKDMEYEGQEGQGIINSKIMNSKEFLASSYVQQNLDNSILSLTPLEQLAFVENLSLDKEVVEKERRNIKEHIKKLETELLELSTQMNSLESSLKYENFDPLSFPKEERPEIDKEKNETNTRLLLQRKKEKKNLEEQLREMDKMDEKNSIFQRLSLEKQELGKRTNSISKKDISRLEKALKASKNFSHAKEKHQKRQTFLSQEREFLENATKKREELIEKMMKEPDFELFLKRKKELEKEKVFYQANVCQLKKAKEKSDELCAKTKKEWKLKGDVSVSLCTKFLNKKLDPQKILLAKAKEELETLLQQKTQADLEKDVLECPKCGENLSFSGGVLGKANCKKVGLDAEKIKGKILEKRQEIRKFEKETKEMENLLSSFSDCVPLEKIPEFSDKELVEISEKIAEHKRNKENLEEFSQELPSWLQRVPELSEKENEVLLEEHLPVSEIQRELDRTKDKLEEQEKISKEIACLEKKLLELSKKLVPNFKEKKSSFLKEVDELEEQIQNLEEQIKLYEKKLVLEMLWKQFQEKMDRYKDQNQKISELSEKRTQKENGLKDAHVLREKSKQAAFLAIERTISSINSSAAAHLNGLFTEDPISISLSTTKETKKGKKMQMSVKISYKGHDFDSPSSLSGGEKQKACLAFVLALNETTASKILLLDESLAQLHSEVNTEILEYLREMAKNKLIIVISHEANRGVFDEIVDV